MAHDAHRHSEVLATAAPPTLSLLRLSAGQRLTGAAFVLAVLWLLVFWVLT
jgi:hypothetical protein